MKVAVIGGGAAGFFAAISVKTHHPASEVILFEKSNKLLAKVRISGGGRCNVTNGSQSIKEVSESYPRGKNLLKKCLKQFSTADTWKWFEERGVLLKVEDDNRVFPVSDNSASIINCLMDETKKLGITINLKTGIKSIEQTKNHNFKLSHGTSCDIFQKVIIATGGSPKRSGFDWIEILGHKISDPVPSLFTFNMPSEKIKSLMGVVAPNVSISLQGSKLKASGPLLITHWGMSGPAVLKLSSFGARILSEKNYHFKININWIALPNQGEISSKLLEISRAHPQKQLSSYRPFGLPERLWLFLLDKNGLPLRKKWGELGKKGMNKLVSMLSNDEYNVQGKTTFKEEFVTCGGVSLESINSKTLRSMSCPGLYFAGEVLDVDGITGGFNFQAAWSTAFIAGKLA